MKKLVFILFVSLFTFNNVYSFNNGDEWQIAYYLGNFNGDIGFKNPDETYEWLVGYGSGFSMEEAKTNAEFDFKVKCYKLFMDFFNVPKGYDFQWFYNHMRKCARGGSSGMGDGRDSRETYNTEVVFRVITVRYSEIKTKDIELYNAFFKK